MSLYRLYGTCGAVDADPFCRDNSALAGNCHVNQVSWPVNEPM